MLGVSGSLEELGRTELGNSERRVLYLLWLASEETPEMRPHFPIVGGNNQVDLGLLETGKYE
jgi:hypothetical protein